MITAPPRTAYLDHCTLETTIAGIPCTVVVHDAEPDLFGYTVYDRRGRRADWLEDKITDADEQRIYWEATCSETSY